MRKINITREMKCIGNDLVILIRGGEEHIGCCVSAQPYLCNHEWHATLNIWNRLSHKDDQIAQLYAKSACLVTHNIVCCLCGIHLDNITSEEMQYILSWCHEDTKKMEKELENE